MVQTLLTNQLTAQSEIVKELPKKVMVNAGQYGKGVINALLIYNTYHPTTYAFKYPQLSGGFYIVTSEQIWPSIQLSHPIQMDGVNYSFPSISGYHPTIYFGFEEEKPIEVPKGKFIFLNNLFSFRSNFADNSAGLEALKLAIKNTSYEPYFNFLTKQRLIRYEVQQRRFIVTRNGFPSFVYQTTNGIGDCGFGSIQGITGVHNINSGEYHDVENKFRALITLLNIELMLAASAYLIFSSFAGIDAKVVGIAPQYTPLRIVFEIAKHSNVLVPILNPNHQDEQGANFEKRTAGRGRHLGAITHYGLMHYYQSQEFKDLKLTL
jgi:hypothetical protein